MMTERESPQARFRREAGLPAKISRSRVCAGDWMRFSVGDRVGCRCA
jgi:hypothetical protein